MLPSLQRNFRFITTQIRRYGLSVSNCVDAMKPLRVLLTGGNGFVGSHILDVLLERGVFVQAVVRSPEKAAKIRKDFSAFDKTRLDFSIVLDMTLAGCYDKCIQESQPLDAIIHTASPFNYELYHDFSEYLEPALRGTVEILRSASSYAPQLKRLVITGSFSAIGNVLDLQGNAVVYSSDSWNPITMEQATSATVNVAYWGSKTFAERAGKKLTLLHGSCDFDTSQIC
jgi:nucleoside-diphosphate-sugar epimerase